MSFRRTHAAGLAVMIAAVSSATLADPVGTVFTYQGQLKTAGAPATGPLTCIGGYAPVFIADEIENNRFAIAGGKPGRKVSWQVTGVRIDPAALRAEFQVIRPKPAEERGTYLCPEGYGEPESLPPSRTANFPSSTGN